MLVARDIFKDSSSQYHVGLVLLVSLCLRESSKRRKVQQSGSLPDLLSGKSSNYPAPSVLLKHGLRYPRGHLMRSTLWMIEDFRFALCVTAPHSDWFGASFALAPIPD